MKRSAANDLGSRPRAVIYCRVSTKEQTQNLSLSTQLAACRKYCDGEGLDVAAEFMEEGESAKTSDRTQLIALLEYCRLHKGSVQFLVVYNVTRFAREATQHHMLRMQLRRLEVTLRSVTEPIDDSSTGKLMEGVLASFAQFDNDVKADRTRAGMTAALSKGRWTFQAPLGYLMGRKPGPSLVPDPTRAPLIREAFETFAQGAVSKRSLLQRLNARGMTSRHGKPLSAQTLGSILRNPIYVGRIESPKFKVSMVGDFDAIVPDEVFSRVQARLRRGLSAGAERHRNHPDFPLRRFVRSGACQTPLTASWSRGRSARYAYYHCRNCRALRVPKGELEFAFRRHLETLQPRPEYLRLFDAIVADTWRRHLAESREQQRRLEARRADLQARRQTLEDAFIFERRIDRAAYERQRDKLGEQLTLTGLDLQDARCEEFDLDGLLEFADQVLANAARLWDASELEHKQRLQRVFFPRGVSYDGREFGTAVTCLAFSHLPAVLPEMSGMASLTPPSWNQIQEWLRALQMLRAGMVAA